MHAVLKTGLPYVPVDTTYPVERLNQIAEQTNAQVIFNFSNVKITPNSNDASGRMLVSNISIQRVYKKEKDRLTAVKMKRLW